ncbi:MAG: LPS assembly lipoprotein LptE [Pirellulaceae bacterium]
MRLLLAILVPLLSVAGGCARYQVGNASLYNSNIRTIHVPIVRNDTFRHLLGVQLTEALVKTIELRTPYKVVASPNADSTLTCRILSENKRTVTEASTDEPRAIERLVTLQLTWTDRQGNLLMTNRFVPDGELAFSFAQAMDFVPEGGQSATTAEHRVLQRLADEIVNQMESRW